MNLYLVSKVMQRKTYNAVVCAEDGVTARSIVGSLPDRKVEVVLLGTAVPGLIQGIICSENYVG